MDTQIRDYKQAQDLDSVMTYEVYNTIFPRFQLSHKSWKLLSELLIEVSFTKGEIIVGIGERNSNHYFLQNGYVRAYFPDHNIEKTLWFAGPGETILNIWGYCSGYPSKVNIEACCNCVTYMITKEHLSKLFAYSLELANWGRRNFEAHAQMMEDTLIDNYRMELAEERYLALIEHSPEILQYVPLKHIATYLWITPQSLSRIRKKLLHKSNT